MAVVIAVTVAAAGDILRACTQDFVVRSEAAGCEDLREEMTIVIRLKGVTLETGIVEGAARTGNSTHLPNIFLRPTNTCSVMCCYPACFSFNSSITMPT